MILTTLEETRRVASTDELRQHYRERIGGWQADPATPLPAGVTVRLSEDAAYGLCWTVIVNGITVDPRCSLVGVLPIN